LEDWSKKVKTRRNKHLVDLASSGCRVSGKVFTRQIQHEIASKLTPHGTGRQGRLGEKVS
jgi:hypothetical protein